MLSGAFFVCGLQTGDKRSAETRIKFKSWMRVSTPNNAAWSVMEPVSEVWLSGRLQIVNSSNQSDQRALRCPSTRI